MVARGQAVSHAVMSGRRAMTKPRRKTPSIGPDVEGCEVHEVQIPGKKIEPQRPFLDTLLLSVHRRFWHKNSKGLFQIPGRNFLLIQSQTCPNRKCMQYVNGSN